MTSETPDLSDSQKRSMSSVPGQFWVNNGMENVNYAVQRPNDKTYLFEVTTNGMGIAMYYKGQLKGDRLSGRSMSRNAPIGRRLRNQLKQTREVQLRGLKDVNVK